MQCRVDYKSSIAEASRVNLWVSLSVMIALLFVNLLFVKDSNLLFIFPVVGKNQGVSDCFFLFIVGGGGGLSSLSLFQAPSSFPSHPSYALEI